MSNRGIGTQSRGLPQPGKGRGYAIASSLVTDLLIQSSRPWLSIALTHFKKAIEQELSDDPSPAHTYWAQLNTRFDLDSIISFSHAWHIWDNPDKYSADNVALDQGLFSGENEHSRAYHEGIQSLAKQQLSFVVPACVEYFSDTNLKALDLGAGLGVQMSALRDEGIVSTAICIDTPFVSKLAHVESPEHIWIGADLRTFDPVGLPGVDLIWIGNILHHYELSECAAILRRFDSLLSPGGVIVIQDYLVGSQGLLGLAASALGVHFALTTSHGRNYTEAEISEFMKSVFVKCHLDNRADGKFSSLLFYRRRK